MLEKFIADYSQEAFHFAFSLCGDVEQSKELVQDAFYKLIQTWDQYDEAHRLDNWYLAILRNLYFDGLKTLENRSTVSLDCPSDSEEGQDGANFAEAVADARDVDMLERLERQETVDGVRAAFDRLSRKHRAILTLCDIKGLGYEQIAGVLKCPLNTVRSRIYRARESLQRVLLERSRGELEVVGEKHEV